MNFKKVIDILGKTVKIADSKTLDEKIPGGKLLFLTGDKYPVIQYEAPHHRHEKVSIDKDGLLVGDEWLLDKAIASNRDVNFVLMNDSMLNAMESIYWALIDKFRQADAVAIEHNIDVIYRLKDAVKANYPESDAGSDIEDVAIALENHDISISKAVRMVKEILISNDIFDVVGIHSYWKDLIK